MPCRRPPTDSRTHARRTDSTIRSHQDVRKPYEPCGAPGQKNERVPVLRVSLGEACAPGIQQNSVCARLPDISRGLAYAVLTRVYSQEGSYLTHVVGFGAVSEWNAVWRLADC